MSLWRSGLFFASIVVALAALTSVGRAVTPTPTPTPLPPIPVPSGVVEDVRSLPAPGNDSVEYVGTHEDSWVGGQVGGVGDVDGDGYDDWITLDSEGNYPSNNLDAQLVWGRPKGSGPASFAVWKFPADAGVTIPFSLDEDIRGHCRIIC